MSLLPLAACAILGMAQVAPAAPVQDKQLATLAGRLFPTLLTIHAPAADPQGQGGAIAAMLAARRQRMAACGQDPHCVIEAAVWRPQERAQMADFAARHPQTGATPTTPSADGIRASVLREIDGLDSILQVYGLAGAPRYPQIDGPDDAQGIKQFNQDLLVALAMSAAGRGDPVTALDPSIGLALSLLDANDHDQAAAFEPLDAKYNAAALARAKTIDWSHYRFTSIIVPGIGPDDLTTPLSAAGKLNVRMAAARFADGVAPFIIVSGGTVHPRGTRFAEAIEMRRALIERFGIPADSIVVDPYARHTTTNLRNVTRRLIALGAPLDRDALIVTNPIQSQYIEGSEFAARNQRELGYQPGQVGKRLSPVELTFRPSIASTRIDPLDPLDP